MKCWVFLLSWVACTPLLAQKPLTSLALNDSILTTAIDRTGDFYAVTTSGQVQRFDKDGRLTLLHKSEYIPTLFDPRDGARLFVYYRKEQMYEYLSPSFRPTASYKIDPSFAIQPWLICPSGDHKLWVLDNADQSLKKIDVQASVVDVEVVVDTTVISSATSFKTMRDYQGFVFLLDPARGIFIFSSLGRYIRTIGKPDVQNFNFLGEELYYLRGDTIELFNLFTAETRTIKVDPGFDDVLLTDERMILFSAQGFDIFAFRP